MGYNMFDKSTISNIKNDITNNLGNNVILETNKGRQKSNTSKGVLKEAYPNVFTVCVKDENENERKLSFSYTDVLINAVEITLIE